MSKEKLEGGEENRRTVQGGIRAGKKRSWCFCEVVSVLWTSGEVKEEDEEQEEQDDKVKEKDEGENERKKNGDDDDEDNIDEGEKNI